jgi:hypothetical protein
MAPKSKSSKKSTTKAKPKAKPNGKGPLDRAASVGRGAAAKVGQVASGLTKATGDAIGGVIARHPSVTPEMLAEIEPRIREIVREELAAARSSDGS